MTVNDVVAMLIWYPGADEEIKVYSNLIKDKKDSCYKSVGVVSLDDNINSSVYNHSNVENKIVNMPDDLVADITAIDNVINELKAVKKEIFKEVIRLDYFQKMVIFYYYFDSKKWYEVSKEVNYSERQCRNYRDSALLKLLKAFEKNKIINNYILNKN